MPPEWLTYHAAGERLGITAEAARQKAIRNRWPKRTGNDGRVNVQVDVQEVLASVLPRRPPVKQEADTSPTPDQTPVDHAADVRALDALEEHITSLKAFLAKAEEQAARERGRTDAERTRADAERDRADRIAAEVTELARRFASSTADAAAAMTAATAREAALQTHLDAIRAQLAAVASRPWWRRLAG